MERCEAAVCVCGFSQWRVVEGGRSEEERMERARVHRSAGVE
jgi:hypothetical protein